MKDYIYIPIEIDDFYEENEALLNDLIVAEKHTTEYLCFISTAELAIILHALIKQKKDDLAATTKALYELPKYHSAEYNEFEADKMYARRDYLKSQITLLHKICEE